MKRLNRTKGSRIVPVVVGNLLFGAAQASAASLYTPIISNVPATGYVECRVVNVGTTPVTVLVELVNGFGVVANSLSCPLPAASSGPGCAVGGSDVFRAAVVGIGRTA